MTGEWKRIEFLFRKKIRAVQKLFIIKKIMMLIIMSHVALPVVLLLCN